MSDFNQQLNQLLRSPKEITQSDLVTIAKTANISYRQVGSKVLSFNRPGEQPLVIPVLEQADEPVRKLLLDEFIRMIKASPQIKR